MAGWAVPAAGREELRLATVMTGGVSLAVWMGGVGHELDRLLHAGPGTQGYAELLEVTGTHCSLDVVAGTSAGGINGALLAFAAARGASMEGLRDLWLEEASLAALLRSPLERRPPSLLRGDEVFLPRLERAFERLAAAPPSGAEAATLRLEIPTTLLAGERRNFLDDAGTVVTDVDHRGRFTFRKGAGRDDFDGPDAARRLALAARCSASFPGAFEASFCPVLPGGPDGAGRARRPDPRRARRPDMRGLLDATTSRWTVDGGLLVNKPLGAALRAIFANPPGDRQIRRVLAYVVPDPGTPGGKEPDRQDDPPAPGRVLLDSLLTIPHAQSVASDLDS